jgi:aquaporin related protein
MPRLSVHRQPKESVDSDSNPGSHEKSRPKLSTIQAHLVAASGEFVGTFMFLYFAFACQVMLHTQSGDRSEENGGFDSQQNIHTALVYGFSLLVNVWAFFRISGGLFNPAVSFPVYLMTIHKNQTLLTRIGDTWLGSCRCPPAY